MHIQNNRQIGFGAPIQSLADTFQVRGKLSCSAGGHGELNCAFGRDDVVRVATMDLGDADNGGVDRSHVP